MEFLVHLHTVIPQDTAKSQVDETIAREAARAAELARQGHILRMWRPPLGPGERRALGLWQAQNEEELRDLVATLPLHIWFSVEITPLYPHPNDPAKPSS
jgi:muconolactone D-isomerase